MFQATRRRLAIWYAALTAVLLLVFATGFYVYVRSTLIDRIDDTLKHVVEVVERSLAIDENPNTGQYTVNVVASFRNNAKTVEDDHIDLEWFSPTGELLWSTLWEPLEIPLHPKKNGETVQLSGGQLLRQFTDRVEIGRQVVGYLRVSHPWFEVTKPIRQLIIDLSLGTSLMAIAISAIAWLLSGLAMKPVRDSYQRLKQFTSDASHELRNPIATIQTNVQVALADPELDSPIHRQQLQLVERLTRRMGRLVDDLLFLARQDSGIVKVRKQPVPMDALLMEVMEEQEAIAAEKGIELVLEIIDPPDSGNHALSPLMDPETEPGLDFTIPGDWDQLARLFTNLVSNGLQYTAKGGQIAITLECSGVSNRPSANSGVQVTVKDSGIGIPAESVPHIFDRFYRVDPARSHEPHQSPEWGSTGSGLGLAIVRAIVENHHGWIRVDSQLNLGTTVSVILPLSKPDPEKPHPEA
ncbi:sensor histidine kinase [Laspinema olomoucense]|uniref:histidine kinase n=1 Tax=Laspinema olomoucense D3b TaxID=2953688 RepID=A0ABT2N0U0_9CYAN|nr:MULTISPECIES: HAMP domain-containing sensor histidine kinase [unclassified Laspinema]MCT7976294.1 HAMP domain-containing histidine kinase [Laspinema sp. D3b]MCT7990989.1 HAMP domain-containing histidine kinase [Laspinema sp. D3a]